MISPKILLVDDEAWQLGIYQRTLEEAGYTCQKASTAEQAIDLIDDAPPDAIVLDALLEQNTAFALLHELQSDAALAAIPIILSTNIASDIRLEEVKPYGVRRIIDKTTTHPADVAVAVTAVLI